MKGNFHVQFGIGGGEGDLSADHTGKRCVSETWKIWGKRQLTSSRLLASSNIAILPLVSPMYVLGLRATRPMAYDRPAT